MEAPIKTILKTVVQRSFESLWSAAFRLLGRLSRPAPEIWSSPGGRRVLVVAPHPDDEVAGCGGAILGHRRRGDDVRICCATDGRRSRAFGLNPEQMAATRRAEATAAAAGLDAELDWIGLPEGEWASEDLEKRLLEVLEQLRPHTVYAPSRVDFHPEHEKVARALASALAVHLSSENGLAPTPDGASCELRIYPIQVPLTPVLTNLVVPVDPSEPRLLEALAAHSSQLDSLKRCLRHRRYVGRLYGLGGAEELWRLTAAQYEQLHRAPPRRPLAGVFRGLRYYAWSDPLAYLRGRGERRRLARQTVSARQTAS